MQRLARSKEQQPPAPSGPKHIVHTALLSLKLKSMKAGLIDPSGKFMVYWDLVIIPAMMYTTFVTTCSSQERRSCRCIANQKYSKK